MTPAGLSGVELRVRPRRSLSRESGGPVEAMLREVLPVRDTPTSMVDVIQPRVVT